MQENSLKKVGLRVPAFFGKVMITLQHLQIRIDWPQTFQMQGTSALSHLQIRIDWLQRLQMQEAAAKIGSADPLSCCAAADGVFAANPCHLRLVGKMATGRTTGRFDFKEYRPI